MPILGKFAAFTLSELLKRKTGLRLLEHAMFGKGEGSGFHGPKNWLPWDDAEGDLSQRRASGEGRSW